MLQRFIETLLYRVEVLKYQLYIIVLLSGVPDLWDRNKILSGGDPSSASLYKSFILFCLICVYSSQFSILFWIMYLL